MQRPDSRYIRAPSPAYAFASGLTPPVSDGRRGTGRRHIPLRIREKLARCPSPGTVRQIEHKAALAWLRGIS